MRPRKIDWENLRARMPGVALSAEVESGVAYSVIARGGGQWAVYKGTLERPEKGTVTQQMEPAFQGDAPAVLLHLCLLGFTLPLAEQRDGSLDLPTPRDLYWDFCREQMPGQPLGCLGGEFRVAFALSPARQAGWKVYVLHERTEDEVPIGDYLLALRYQRALPVQALCEWRGNRIGGRYGIVFAEQIPWVLALLGVDADGLSAGAEGLLPTQEPEVFGDPFAEDNAATDPVYRPIPLQVVSADIPSRERIRGRKR